ncbi:hypothetical protein [Sphingomonas qomolangmaensis]|uniref:Secreted protein n=1 Tax=Sphingomonas qomolangmaensis TaxID=2918765 RepID=A0ABY5LBM8_9SPHN|nr:hypothetical protein [Sphingomonas qomolangmaensis]UUL83423.1 hypothetical protein NMP03_04120 [Sphingomonas qomolangmaensis]
MNSFLAAALFSTSLAVAVTTILLTVRPYAHRIVSLLTHGVQYRSMPLPAPRPRATLRVTPRVTVMPARLRAAA